MLFLQLMSGVDTFDENLRGEDLAAGKVPLCRVPPNYRPMPTKPMFFDLALNHIQVRIP